MKPFFFPLQASPAVPPTGRRRPLSPPWPAGHPRARPKPAIPPPSSAQPSRFTHIRSWLTRPPFAATLLVCALALVARRPDLLRNPQFWAEDGPIFFQQNWEQGLAALAQPYAGYLHTVQRLVAALAGCFDPRFAPAIFIGATAALTLYVAARTQSTRLPFRPHVAYALAVVLVPDAFEVLLFLVNVQWVLAAGLLLLLVSSDATRPRQHVHDIGAAVMLGLTGPFSVLFAPLFVWRALHRRSRASATLAALMLGCAVVQAWYIWQGPPSEPPDRVALEHALAVPGMRIGASLFAGNWVRNEPLLVETALGVLTLVAAAYLGLRRGPARMERSWLACALGLLLVASLFRVRNYLPGLCQADFCPRYFFAPQLVFLWLLTALTGDSRRWVAGLAGGALLWCLAANLPRLRERPLVDQHWAAETAKLTPGQSTTIAINPTDWSVTLSGRKP